MNCRHRDFQSRALPAELSRPAGPAGRPRPSAFEKVPRAALGRQTHPRSRKRERRRPGAASLPSSGRCVQFRERPIGGPAPGSIPGTAPCTPGGRAQARVPAVRPMTIATAGVAGLAASVHPATGTTDASPICATRDAGSHPAKPPAVGAVTRCTAGPCQGRDRAGRARRVDARRRSGWPHAPGARPRDPPAPGRAGPTGHAGTGYVNVRATTSEQRLALPGPGSPRRPQSSPASSAVTDESSGRSPLSARSRLIRSTIGGCVEKSPLERCSNFLIGFVK